MTTTSYLVPSLLLLALVLPTVGALVARLIARQSYQAMLIIGGVTAAVAMASVVALQFIPVDQIALGRYAIFVPARAPLVDNQTFALVRPTPPLPATTEPSAPVVALAPTLQPIAVPPTLAPPTPAPSLVTTALPAPTPSATASDTPVPATATIMPTNTLIPTATTTPTTRPRVIATTKPTRRKYSVQKGDSLRSIAAQSDVSVQALLDANDLTPKEGDNLQIDQTLIIPTH
ncbi:MAG: LysM peptidoglycan-binding domain-containing protein [Herpetosiphonaceae bacterium]|nr:LysM peptidoglycan-binding domain-containing protein [Herpetosiphonaceae bacterium]